MGCSSSQFEITASTTVIYVDKQTPVPAEVYSTLLQSAARRRERGAHVRVFDADGKQRLRLQPSTAPLSFGLDSMDLGDKVRVVGLVDEDDLSRSSHLIGGSGRITKISADKRRFQVEGCGNSWFEDVELDKSGKTAEDSERSTAADSCSASDSDSEVSVQSETMSAGQGVAYVASL